MMTDIFLDQAFRDALPEETIAALKARAIMYEKWYNAGLIDAARKADGWAAECCGGSGEGSQGYKNLAESIRNMQRT
jgi:hypothetical protein